MCNIHPWRSAFFSSSLGYISFCRFVHLSASGLDAGNLSNSWASTKNNLGNISFYKKVKLKKDALFPDHF